MSCSPHPPLRFLPPAPFTPIRHPLGGTIGEVGVDGLARITRPGYWTVGLTPLPLGPMWTDLTTGRLRSDLSGDTGLRLNPLTRQIEHDE